MNRDESLAFWYLRLNGFFLVPHYVVHTEPPSEIDILALRPPNVQERVGGQPDDWDSDLVTDDDLRCFVCVLCEVKGGQTYEPESIFRPNEIEYTLPRFGILNPEERKQAIQELRDAPRSSPREHLQIRKLLVAHHRLERVAPCDFVTIEETRRFIRGRLEKYRDPKGRARTLFNADRIDELLADIDRNRGSDDPAPPESD